ncbi:MAG: hypothetical protein RLZZ232_3182 [Planctomycetota bacterium]|jgi:hypothetical protein
MFTGIKTTSQRATILMSLTASSKSNLMGP